MCAASVRLGACEEYCLGIVGAIQSLCVRESERAWIEVGGWEKPVECLHSSDLIYNSAPQRSVRSFSRSPLFALCTEGGDKCSMVHYTASPHLSIPIYHYLSRGRAAVSSSSVNFTEWRCSQHTQCVRRGDTRLSLGLQPGIYSYILHCALSVLLFMYLSVLLF